MILPPISDRLILKSSIKLQQQPCLDYKGVLMVLQWTINRIYDIILANDVMIGWWIGFNGEFHARNLCKKIFINLPISAMKAILNYEHDVCLHYHLPYSSQTKRIKVTMKMKQYVGMLGWEIGIVIVIGICKIYIFTMQLQKQSI